MTYAIALLLTLIITIVLTLALAVLLHDLESVEKNIRCEDCTYYRNRYCTHWEEVRNADQKTCDVFKQK